MKTIFLLSLLTFNAFADTLLKNDPKALLGQVGCINTLQDWILNGGKKSSESIYNYTDVFYEDEHEGYIKNKVFDFSISSELELYRPGVDLAPLNEVVSIPYLKDGEVKYHFVKNDGQNIMLDLTGTSKYHYGDALYHIKPSKITYTNLASIGIDKKIMVYQDIKKEFSPGFSVPNSNDPVLLAERAVTTQKSSDGELEKAITYHVDERINEIKKVFNNLKILKNWQKLWCNVTSEEFNKLSKEISTHCSEFPSAAQLASDIKSAECSEGSVTKPTSNPGPNKTLHQ